MNLIRHTVEAFHQPISCSNKIEHAVSMARDFKRITESLSRLHDNAQATGGHGGVDVQTKDGAYILHRALFYHQLRTALTFFGEFFPWLHDHSYTVIYASLREFRGCTHYTRHVHIMSASMHDTGALRAVWHGVVLGNRQGIHISTQCNSRSRAQISNQTGGSESGCDFVSGT